MAKGKTYKPGPISLELLLQVPRPVPWPSRCTASHSVVLLSFLSQDGWEVKMSDLVEKKGMY